MFPLLALAGLGAGAATGISGLGLLGAGLDIAGAVGQHSANQAAQANANRNIAFQREMAETAIQKRVKDLQAAGLSPMLAYSGMGASMASGGTSIPEAKAPVATAMQARLNRMAAEQAEADLEVKHATAANQRSQAKLYDFQSGEKGSMELSLMGIEARFREAGIHKTEAEIRQIGATIEKIKAEVQFVRQGTMTSAASAEEIKKRTEILGIELKLKDMDRIERFQTLQAVIQQTFNETELKELMLKNWTRYDTTQDTGWRNILRWLGFGSDEVARAIEATATMYGTRRMPK